jgi:hypothetical protein
MLKRSLVLERCRRAEKVGGLAQVLERPHGAIGNKPPITLQDDGAASLPS